ncbi:DNA cytosine methyltransferase [Rhodococcus sp. NCIMB 12038]|uniref:DNA cytosine methyltransferase n=1 Tax=Rhodococcus sp. NCIMB 12038 TaxID=933800 RepID=UPI000B3C5DA3|nr:DNA cytosine methyltransferase [Rhodococcus sp. NCIMB 12038]OUS97423.1 DNA cytosine methyltransferase [Rhodococcus sp. NCIMB 12038]
MSSPASAALGILDATDLFSGGGGSSKGLTQAGIRVRVAANHWDVAVATHEANHPDTEHRLANLSEVDWRTFPRTNILWGSPSCVWHARSGGRKKPTAAAELRGNDPGSVDRATAFAIIAATEVHEYDAVIVENVPEFMDWALYPWWLDGMRALGYVEQVVILNAIDFGMPQHRVRYFAVFTRTGDVDLSLPDIAPVHADAIIDPNPGKLVTRKLYVADQLAQITEPHVPHTVTYRRNAKARRADRHPLATITAGGNHHGVATLTDNGMRFRMLSNRECARAQGFPDDYRFAGKVDEVKKQIGNAVPVGVARWLGERVSAAIGCSAAAA